MIPPELKAVIFDLDGVLADTSRFHGLAWAELVRGLGIEPPADLEEQVRGISRMASLRIALGARADDYPEAELNELAARKNEHYLRLIQQITPADLFPGALELFDGLKRAGIKIALGSASKNAQPVLDSLQITRYFDAIADGFRYKHGKPHPDVFVTAARMLGAAPADCIVVEDAAAGITAALDGGFVAVGFGNFQSLKHSHHCIRSLTELNAENLCALHARFNPQRWSVVREGVQQPQMEDACHTIFCVGNGRLGVRGKLAELPVGGGAGIYMAGFYDTFRRPPHDPSTWSPFMKYWGNASLAAEEQIEVCIVNCPNFLDVEWTIDGELADGSRRVRTLCSPSDDSRRVRTLCSPSSIGDETCADMGTRANTRFAPYGAADSSEKVNLAEGSLTSLRRHLDLRSGMFTAEAHWTSPSGRELRFVQRRFADMANASRVFVQYEIEALNFSGRLEVRAGIRTDTANASELGPQRLYEVIGDDQAAGATAVGVAVKGTSAGMQAAFATALKLVDRHDAAYRVEKNDRGMFITASTNLVQDKILYIERVAAVASNRIDGDPVPAVMRSITSAPPFSVARIESTARWQQLWSDSDIIIEGDPGNQLGARYSIFQLLIAGSHDDPGVSIPAKGLTADGYRGMVFWDTDIHMTSFFNLTQPQIARNLAMFRFNTLDGARTKARRYGFLGASYPWETGVSGNEECEKWLKLITHQSHITADVAYALQQYVDCTGDADFYENYAAEVLVETGRFWLSKCVRGSDAPASLLSIPDAGGPDEFHVVCNDSAYVNNFARCNLALADKAAKHLRRHAPDKLAAIKQRTGLTDDELARFSTYPARIKTMERPGGLIEQCEGFFGLRDEIIQNAWISDPFNTQTVKQADVMMLLYLMPDAWPKPVVKANWDYYEPRTVHQSSLSHAAHGIIAAELGLAEKAEHYIKQSLGMDLHDEMGNAAHGAHMAAHGMNWSAIVRGYGGARPSSSRFLVEPRLPKNWTRLQFNLKWRGTDFTVDVTHEQVTVANKPAEKAALPLRLCGKDCEVKAGEECSAQCR